MLYRHYTSYDGLSYTNTTALNDGMFVIIDGIFIIFDWGLNSAAGVPLYTIAVDVNGWKKKPNKFGHDLFAFQILNNKLYPAGGSDGTKTSYVEENYCITDGSSTNISNGLGCTSRALRDPDYFKNLGKK